MEPRPSQSGGSLSANSGAGMAAFISVGGTSVRACARRSSVPVRPGVTRVWQIGKSALDVAGATVALAAPISTPPPASMILSASEPRETPPTMIAVVENRASRERCVMIALQASARRTDLLHSDEYSLQSLHAGSTHVT